MAYIANDPNQDPNNQNGSSGQSGQGQSQGQQPLGQPVNVSGTAASGGVSSGGAKAPSATPTATSSGSFQNLQNYLNANSGVNLAGNVGNTLTQQEQGLQSQNDVASQGIQSSAQSAAAPYSQPLSYTSSPSGPTSNQLSQWQSYYNAPTYSAPTYDASGALANNQQNFQQTANNTNTESGRLALLNQIYANPGYSTGQQSLDQLILSGNPTQLSGLQSTAGNLVSQLGQNYSSDQAAANAANAAAQGTIGAAKGQAQTVSAQALPDLLAPSVASGTANTNLQNVQNTFNANVPGNYSQALQGLVSGGVISPAEMTNIQNALGPLVTQNPNFNVNTFLTNGLQYTPSSGATTTGLNESLTPQQASTLNSLSQMANGTPSNYQAGTYTPASLNLNLPSMIAALQPGAQQAQTALNTNYQKLLTPTTGPNGVQGNQIGAGVPSTGSPQQDIQNLQADIANRQQPGSNNQAPYIATDQQALQSLQALINNYSTYNNAITDLTNNNG